MNEDIPQQPSQEEILKSERQRVQKTLWGDFNVDQVTFETCEVEKTLINVWSEGRTPEGASGFKKKVELMEARCKELFPNTFEKEEKTWGECARQLEFLYHSDPTKMEIISPFLNNEGRGGYFHPQGDSRIINLYSIASFLKGEALSETDPVQDLESQIKGKKVLILGDDTGSLSEMLNTIGAEAVGVEYHPFKVLVAHSGICSDSGKPQEQVIQGDIASLTDKNSALFRELEQKGPFDLIYSFAVFNGGSGLDDSIVKFSGGTRLSSAAVRAFMTPVINNSNALLKPEGFQLHQHTPDLYYFGMYGVRENERTREITRGTGHEPQTIFIRKAISPIVEVKGFEDIVKV
jgi:hypothetical protein